MIRRKGDGYEILDMGSTNGTWLNQYLLLPDKPYPLKSGTQIRLGRLSLLVLFEKTTSEH
jgi:pSer/pThr/pTyr-binding forkhead associated (FHA) protein